MRQDEPLAAFAFIAPFEGKQVDRIDEGALQTTTEFFLILNIHPTMGEL
jgi:hypothetical protein